jgi:hypothetical protein
MGTNVSNELGTSIFREVQIFTKLLREPHWRSLTCLSLQKAGQETV